MRSFRLVFQFLAVLAVMVCASSAMAQRAVPRLSFTMDGWKFIPTLYNGQVESFVALRTAPPVGDNLTTMWFVKQAGGDWASLGFQEQDQAKTVGCIKALLLLSSTTDEAWPVVPAAVNPAEYPRAAIVRGVFENDPFATAVGSSTDPTALLDFLVTAGWQAARSSIFAGNCPLRDRLNAYAAGVEADVVDLTHSMNGTANALANTCQVSPPLPCTAYTIDHTWTNCAPGTWAWTATHQHPVFGGCVYKNCYAGTVTETEIERRRFFYSNCTSCLQEQQRTRTCQVDQCEIDTRPDAPSFPCGQPALPYTPPSAPNAAMCDCDRNNCSAWSAWAWNYGPCGALF